MNAIPSQIIRSRKQLQLTILRVKIAVLTVQVRLSESSCPKRTKQQEFSF